MWCLAFAFKRCFIPDHSLLSDSCYSINQISSGNNEQSCSDETKLSDDNQNSLDNCQNDPCIWSNLFAK